MYRTKARLRIPAFNLALLTLFIISCERYDFERVSFTKVIRMGSLEVGFNSAFLLGDIEGLRNAEIIETGFVFSRSAMDDQNLRLGQVNVEALKSPTPADSTTKGDLAFAASGYQTLCFNKTGQNNTASGKNALYYNKTGDNNTANGYSAFMNPFFSNISNSTALGYDAQPGASNSIRLGNVNVPSIGGYANWTNVSDGRFKVDVEENVVGLEFIRKLRPVTYHQDMDALAAFNNTADNLRLLESDKLKAAELQVGFIAQEVEAAAKELNFDFHGVDAPKNETSHYGLRYAEFVAPLVKAVQEQQEMIEELSKEIEALKWNSKVEDI